MLTNEQIEQIDKMSCPDKRQLAYNTDNIDILEYLSSDEYCYARFYVTINAHTSVRTLIKLSKDKSELVSIRAGEQLEKYNINIDKYTTKGILE